MIRLYRDVLSSIGANRKVCSGRYPPKGQVGVCFGNHQISGGLVNAFNAVNRGNLANIYKYGFQLATVHDFQAGINARVYTIGPAHQVSNVRTSSADHGGNVGKQSSAIASANLQLDREGCGILAAPLHGYATLRLVKQILHVGARSCVHRDTAAARYVPNDFVTRNGVAALRAINQQIVMPFDDKRRLTETQ